MRKEVSPEKLLDMTRSILPSKARKRARKDKAMLKRGARRAVRQDVRIHNEDSPIDLTRDVSMRWIVWARQGADKLNHFMRWCETLTQGMPLRRKLQFIRALLPATVVGNHAYAHWEAHCRRSGRIWIPYKKQLQRSAQSLYDRARHALRAALAEQPSLAGALNAHIKSRKMSDEPRRMLHGVHDVDAFVRDVLEDCRYKTERAALRSFRLPA